MSVAAQEAQSLITALNSFLEEARNRNQINELADWMIINLLNSAGFIRASIHDNRHFELDFQSENETFSVVPNRKARLGIHKIRINDKTEVLEPLGSQAIGKAAEWVLDILKLNPAAIFHLKLVELQVLQKPKAVILDRDTSTGTHLLLQEALRKKGYDIEVVRAEQVTEDLVTLITASNPDLFITEENWESESSAKQHLFQVLFAQQAEILTFDNKNWESARDAIQAIMRSEQLT